MANMIVPEGQSDADRIADFVNGYLGKNKQQNQAEARKVLDIAGIILAYKASKILRRTRRRP